MKNKNIWVGLIIATFVVAGIVFLMEQSPKSMVEIGRYFGIDGNEIQNPYSVVGGVEGVKYITLNVNIENLDSVPLTFRVESMTPVEIDSSKPSETITIDAGETGQIETGLIDIERYEGSIQDFCVEVVSEQIPSLREEAHLNGCVSVSIEPNPEGQFSIIVDSGVGDGTINPGCTESWNCGNWGSCISGIETRVCTDENTCGTSISKPGEEQACDIGFQTNAGGNYRTSGVWIDFGSGKYYYGGYSSYDCLPENVIIRTPEGFSICTRPGYELSSRVYLDDGRGNIYKP